MATRGRKPTPTALKVLEGNPGKRKLNDNEPRPEKKAPSCPKWLEPEAKKEWRRLAKKMEQMGVLTEVDMAAFAGYCQAAAGSPGIYRADVPKDHEPLCRAVRPDAFFQVSDHCGFHRE